MLKRVTALLALSCSSVAMAGPAGWKISESSGSVQISSPGLSKAAVRGSAVSAGDTVTTGQNSRAVLVRGTEYMMVAPNSRLRLPANQTETTGVTTIFEDFGNVVFMIKKKMTPHFQVRTPYLAAVVKGTTFSVGVTDQGTSLQVLEGAVEVATSDGRARDLITPGAVALVLASNRHRLQVEDDGKTRIIDSPAANEPGSAPAPTNLSAASADPANDGATESSTSPVAAPGMAASVVITTAAYAPAVSLADATGGLVVGNIGGAELAKATTAATAAATTAVEASTSTAKLVQSATMILAAQREQAKASEAARKAGVDLSSASQAKADADAATPPVVVAVPAPALPPGLAEKVVLPPGLGGALPPGLDKRGVP